MKLVRQRELLRFLRWLAEYPVGQFPESLLELMLLYAVRSDSTIDVETVFRNVSANPELRKAAMSVADQLEARGMEKGTLIGGIRALEEFLGLTGGSAESLKTRSLEELEIRHQELQQDYETRFKRG